MIDIILRATLTAAVAQGTPLLLTALGEIMNQRAGVLNLGLDGMMLFGAVTAFISLIASGSLFVAVLVGGLCAALLALIHAFLSVTCRVHQVICGLALNMLALGLTGYLYKLMCNAGGHLQIGILPQLPLLGLQKIPVLGEAFFRQDILVYIVCLLAIACFIFYRFTRIGLAMASIGENPMAADAAAIPVERCQMIACALNGALGGLGGAYLIVAQLGMFSDNMTAGRGYIALAAVILGRYCPGGVALASLLFGVANAAQIRLQALGSTLPMQLLAMLPYVVTLCALVLTSGRSREPKALSKPYIRGSR